ncbi:MAG: group II intron reverse transcriptase/maturase [Clostridia bacterium]
MNRQGAPGVDHVSVAEYGLNLDANLADLVDRMKRRAYDARPVRRVYIPKAGSDKMRPLGIPAVEDRLLQAAVARLLSAIYEPIFRDSSFGFRPGRSAHDALRRVREAVMGGRVQYVYETDIRSFFDRMDHGWLLRMLELKVGDPWILRLVRKWLKAGIFENGSVTQAAVGAPQGGPLSPVLANVYLHYALDLWFDKVVRPTLRGRAELVRYADDLLALFEDEEEAQRFAQTLPERLAKFGLEVAPEKTQLIPFGARFWRQGRDATGTFDFLGFSHHLRTDRKGRMAVVRVPCAKSVRRFLMETKAWLRANMHLPPAEQHKALAARLSGFYQYFALWHCQPRLKSVRYQVLLYWKWTLSRRSQRGFAAWTWLNQRRWFRLPLPRLLHRTV